MRKFKNVNIKGVNFKKCDKKGEKQIFHDNTLYQRFLDGLPNSDLITVSHQGQWVPVSISLEWFGCGLVICINNFFNWAVEIRKMYKKIKIN